MGRCRAVISLGSNLVSNLGDSTATIAAAAKRIAATPGIELIALSTTYTSLPAVVYDQPHFKNAAALLETELSPPELLRALQAIEKEFGRMREGADSIPSGPRTLDLDIIDMEGVVLDSPELTLPHPQALHRAFVVIPLLEISPHHVFANQKVVNDSAVDCGEIVSDGPDRPSATQSGSYSPTGLLSVCATPIGNLGDITLRVLEALHSADAIYCEDTRVTRKLTTRYEIGTPLLRADAHKLPELLPRILSQLAEGKRLTYVSDAGMPGISDPGGLLVAAVRNAGHRIEVLPGASALTTALAISGIKAHNHYFGGYFPRKPGDGRRLLEEVGQLEDTVLVFYESVHRVVKTLKLIAMVLPVRQVTMVRELTKIHEELVCKTAEELTTFLLDRATSGRTLKGEIVLLIAPQGTILHFKA